MTNKVKRIIVELEDHEDLIFEPGKNDVVSISTTFGVREVPNSTGIVLKEHNGLRVTNILIGSSGVMDNIKSLTEDIIERALN